MQLKSIGCTNEPRSCPTPIFLVKRIDAEILAPSQIRLNLFGHETKIKLMER